jgi:hypothetical protein
MEESPPQQLTEKRQERPNLLTVLCILTFIGSGMNLFSSVIIAAFYDVFVEIARDFSERFNLPGLALLMEMKPSFFLVTAVFYAGSIAGAVLMMRLKKQGFHVYTISQILLLLAPMYYLHLAAPGLPELIFTGLFILLYRRNLKFMS